MYINYSSAIKETFFSTGNYSQNPIDKVWAIQRFQFDLFGNLTMQLILIM